MYRGMQIIFLPNSTRPNIDIYYIRIYTYVYMVEIFWLERDGPNALSSLPKTMGKILQKIFSPFLHIRYGSAPFYVHRFWRRQSDEQKFVER